MSLFRDRYEEMGLTYIGPNSFEYKDSLSCVMYRQLEDIDTKQEIPMLGVYTKSTDRTSVYKFVTVVSEVYQFEGNEKINKTIRDTISNINSAIFEEYPIISNNFSVMRNEIILRHQNNIPEVGDIYPQVIVFNTYNGSGAKDIKFGFVIYEGGRRISSFGFKTKIVSMRQVHTENSRTTATSMGNFIEDFNANILDIIRQNMSNTLTPDDIMKTLDLIEKVGKRKRQEISVGLEEISSNGVISNWNMFLAITKFSAIEKNINSKSLLENIAERVLILPGDMFRVLNVNSN